MMTWLRRVRALWNLLRVSPRQSAESWTAQNSTELSTFLKNTSAGVKLLNTFRNGVVEQAMKCTTARTANDAIYENGVAAGYRAAVAVIDELSGANSWSEEDASGGPELSTDLDWFHNPKQ